MLKPKKQKKCKECRELFEPKNSMQKTCWKMECAITAGRREQEARKKREAREWRAETRRRKEKIKSRSKWIKEAQEAFNAYIRERDKDLPCICCGEWADEGWKPGGSWDAGHYKSVGAHPELRFEPLNCHKQLKSCNAGEGKYSKKSKTVNQGYRERLPQKIGQEAFDWLNGPHKEKKYTIEELKAIKAEYKQRLKELKDD